MHGRPPSEVGFRAFLALCLAHRPRIVGYLMFPEGGLPNAKQRAEAASQHRLFEPRPTAVITSLADGQGVSTALGWMRGLEWFRAFSPPKLAAARAYLGVSNGDWQEGLLMARSLAASVGVTLGELPIPRSPWADDRD